MQESVHEIRREGGDENAQRLAALEAIFGLLASEVDERVALTKLCALLTEFRGYQLAWIGRARPDHVVQIVAASGPASEYVRKSEIRWDEGPHGSGPAGSCIKTQVPIFYESSDPKFAAWREGAEAYGIRSLAAIPFAFHDRTRGVLDVASAEPVAELHRDEPFLRLVTGILGMRELLSAEGGRSVKNLQRLQLLEKRLRLFVEQLPVTLFAFDKHGSLTDAHGAGLAKLGVNAPDLIGRTVAEINGVTDQNDPRLQFMRTALGGKSLTADVAFGEHQLQVYLEPVTGVGGAVEGVLGVALDITDRVRAEEARRKSEAVLEKAEEMAHFGTWRHDFQSDEVWWSKELYRILGLEPGSVVPTKEFFYGFDHPDDRDLIQHVVDECLQRHGPYSFDHRIVRNDGQVRWVQEQGEFFFAPDGTAIGHSGTLLDITDRKLAEERLAYLAHHDALTNLPNRLLLADRLSQSLAHAKRRERYTAVLFFDIDRFKQINDSLGHAVGDNVLSAVAHLVRNALREGDTVARPGGDEFVIVLDDVAHPADVALVARNVQTVLGEPLNIDGRPMVVSASVGVAIYPEDGDDAETLIRNADTAMYKAKEAGGNRIQFFTAEMHKAAMERLDLQLDLRRALERRQLSLVYQPIVDFFGRVVELEALLRWQHPTRGPVPPSKFIPIAEDTGLILPIGKWVLQTACAQMKRWQDMGLPRVRVSVNLSTRQFEHPDIAETVAATLKETGLPPELLNLEITESAILNNLQAAISIINPLKAAGVKLAIDDFGSGHAGLFYLKQFRVDTVKLDRSYVDGLPDDPEDVAITDAVISLGHALKMRVIAEGVETEGQRAFLKARGCDEMQGYLVQRPGPPEAIEEFLLKACSGSPAGR